MDIKKKLDMFMNETFMTEKLENVIGDRFGRYSKYIIQERAIPDVRDGLKPVQRRILYAMSDLGITSNAPYKKSARIAGEVMGKYHPHGDSSIYEAMVRLSQNWKMGVTLIDMHGNNGSIDGDGPAAMRYTEARMSKNAEFLLKDIDKNTVPFIPNFDEEEIEPTVLPAKFPNLLVNGCMGISSGYATYIPTHNLNEVVEATIYKIDHPNMNVDDLLNIMKGPDFPTGGIVQGLDGIREAFLTGSGTVIVRSKYSIEQMSKDGQERIVIYEIPYDTVKSKTVEKIDQLRMDGKIPDCLEVRDESDREGLRIAIDLKKGANANAILTYLFKNTDLQVNLKYNMVSICEKRPVRLGVLQILDAYITHQKEVITNRTNFDLNKAEKRLHIVDGLIKMISIVDEVIKTIRASKNKADSKQNLMLNFSFSELQAEAIVTMQLYRLSSTDIEQLRQEQQKLKDDIIEYHLILSSEKELLKVIKGELRDVNKQIVTPRKTVIENEISDLKIDETELISKEQVMVCVTKENYIKRVSIKSFNSAKQNGLKEGDSVQFLEELSTLDTLLMFTDQGNYIYLPVYKIDETKFKDLGIFISSIVSIQPKEKIIRVFAISDFNSNSTVLLASSKGMMKQTLLSDFNVTRYNKSIKAMKLSSDETLVSVDISSNPLEIVACSSNCDVLRFRASDISLYGTQAGGIKSINMKPDDSLASAFYANKEDDIVILTQRGTIKRIKITDIPLTKRSRSGSTVIKRVKSNPYLLIDAKRMSPNQYKEDCDINIIYTKGNDIQKCFTLKYNISDSGKSILNDELGSPLRMTISNPKNQDEQVSGDYLIEVKNDLFNLDVENEKPLIISKKMKQTNILDELDEILRKETENKEEVKKDFDVKVTEDENKIVKETKSSTIIRRKVNNGFAQINADDSINDKKKDELPFKKISLFDDES